jgi:AcrR family transcriptional regulator
MARIDKGALTRLEIVAEASEQFLEKGYSNTTIASISQALEMSKGNLTFYYKTKEHLLAELVELLCEFHWERMKKEANDGISSIMAICLELTAMAAACEGSELARDFYASSYASHLTLPLIREVDTAKVKEIFGAYCPHFTEEQWVATENVVSGIEYATIMTREEDTPLALQIEKTLDTILYLFGVPHEVREAKIAKVLSMDYRALGERLLTGFPAYVMKINEENLKNSLREKRKRHGG